MEVYHGSYSYFKVAEPSYTKRVHYEHGKLVTDFEGVTLHVTPDKWIALAYTANRRKTFMHKKKRCNFNFGVPVKQKDSGYHNKIITIFGKRSLQYSLNKLYGKGGYLYTFRDKDFKAEQGIGENELISYEKVTPTNIHFIKNIVKEMQNQHVNFRFIDITKQQI